MPKKSPLALVALLLGVVPPIAAFRCRGITHHTLPLRPRSGATTDAVMLTAATAPTQPAEDESRTPSLPLVAFVTATGLSICTLARRWSLSDAAIITTAALGTSSVLPTAALLGLRLTFLSVVAVSLYSSLTDKVPHVFNLMLYKDSKLAPKAVPFKGFERLTTFTTQCWMLQGLYFAAAALASLAHLGGFSLPAPLLRATHMLFDVCVATAMLVTAVVTFVLIPARISRGDAAGLARMLTWRPMCMHNLNLLFVATEMLFNGLPIVLSHALFPAIFGIQYVLTSWWWLKRTGIVYYPFLDPTLPPAKAIAVHAGLFGVLVAFFALRVAVANAASIAPLALRVPALYAAALAITWWPRVIRGWPKGLQRVKQGAGGE